MRIQHNIMAMNAYRNYNNNTSALSKNLEKLSSGYKINRAGDDAAGLAISEKMRAQITGLDAAQKNVKDGISLVKTAEGAMQEIQDMLNRMDYLATQSANGTYQNEVDREALQKEVNQLKDEINRIADSANFNGIKLLDGSLEAKETEVVDSSAGTEVQDVVVTAPNNGDVVTTSAAKGAGYTTGDIADRTANIFEAVQITYTNKAGEEKTITLGSKEKLGAAGGSGKGGEEVAAAINDGTMSVSTTDSNAKTDLEEFLDTFKVTGDGKTMSIEAKDPEGGAKVTEVKYKAGADLKTALDGLATTGKATAAAGPQVEVKLTAATKPSVIKIGSTTYESEEGSAVADRAKDLIKQLKEDGYDVSLKENTTDTIVIKNLQETQKGVQIGNTTTDKWLVRGDASAKGKAEFTMDTAADTSEHTFTLNYINEAGENASKKLTYKAAAASAGEAAKALKAAIEGDSDLSSLFKVTVDTDAVTIESKGSGTNSAYVTGVSSDKLKVANAEVTITKPKDTGKVLTTNLNKAESGGEKFKNGDQLVVDGKTYQFVSDPGAPVEDGVIKVAIDDDPTNGIKETWKNLQKALAANGVESEFYEDAKMYKKSDGTTDVAGMGLRFVDAPAKTEMVKSGGLQLQIGDTADSYNQLRVSVGDMHTKALGIADLDIGDPDSAAKAIDVVKAAINKVSSVRGDLGAYQNRLEHTQNNLSVMAENITDAESTIRDTDVADEMMAYVKNNILIQSAQAMLAQANQVPQGVLQLLG